MDILAIIIGILLICCLYVIFRVDEGVVKPLEHAIESSGSCYSSANPAPGASFTSCVIGSGAKTCGTGYNAYCHNVGCPSGLDFKIPQNCQIEKIQQQEMQIKPELQPMFAATGEIKLSPHPTDYHNTLNNSQPTITSPHPNQYNPIIAETHQNKMHRNNGFHGMGTMVPA